ncbi:MAG: hypothetical protein CMG64_03870 [Candidatus Marinimicrobia bacterium]|nr:hypothetical protein [Candidatus Neomarinimicrobiota bacterium]|tara:strand:+ start:10891 stop:11805 length:915 start_codon:yes stop_codon:yes gene_type:complete
MINDFKLPSFFIVGAQKCGTTTLHNLLSQDPRISLPKYKETHFFSTNYDKGIDWYRKQFSNNKYLLRGEVDPSYIFFPNVFKRIKREIKNPKFIFIFRRPLDRSYSHYIMSKSRGYEKLSFSDAINKENQRLKDGKLFSFTNFSYLKRSEYSIQLNHFFDLFNRENCIFIKFDDLFNKKMNKDKIKYIYDFLDLEFQNNIDFNIKKNSASISKSDFITNNLYNYTFLRQVLRKIIISKNLRYKIKKIIDGYNRKSINPELLKMEKIKIFDNLSDSIIDWNNKEVKKIMEIIKIDLTDWYINGKF